MENDGGGKGTSSLPVSSSSPETSGKVNLNTATLAELQTLPGIGPKTAAQIDWAIEPKSLDVIADHPALDQIHVFERPEGFWAGVKAFRSFCQTLRNSHYDMVLDFHGIFKSGYAMGATRAATRTAFAFPLPRIRITDCCIDLFKTG